MKTGDDYLSELERAGIRWSVLDFHAERELRRAWHEIFGAIERPNGLYAPERRARKTTKRLLARSSTVPEPRLTTYRGPKAEVAFALWGDGDFYLFFDQCMSPPGPMTSAPALSCMSGTRQSFSWWKDLFFNEMAIDRVILLALDYRWTLVINYRDDYRPEAVFALAPAI